MMNTAASYELMRAARIHAYGDSSKVQLETVTRPIPALGEVLVRIHAAGVNPIDWKVREGFMGSTLGLPAGLGYDLAGIVLALGDGVSKLAVGDRVFGMLSTVAPGTYAEAVAAPATWLAHIPGDLDFVRAAALPMGVLTAWMAVVDRGGVARGQRVLVHGGSGAVGLAAIQLAKQNGAWVAATASGEGMARVLAAGADLMIDYRQQRFEDAVSDIDLVIDTQGGETQHRSWVVLREGGVMVSTLGTPDAGVPAAQGRHAALGFGTTPDGARLHSLGASFASGALGIPVVRTLQLSEAASAMDLQQSGRAGGKIVLTVI